MKKYLVLPALLVVAISTILYSFCSSGNAKNKPAGQGFAVVELFTSEGCSSCPPADAIAAKFAKQYAGQVYVLGFHVDYWDRLGWKDAYSDPAWTNRQKEYASILSLQDIYTPQVIVNGKKDFVGSDESNLRIDIMQEIMNNPKSTIKLGAKKVDDKSVAVTYDASSSDESLLNIALIQLHAKTAVEKGENEGKKLEHINIVRALQIIPVNKSAAGSININLPAGLQTKDCKLVGYLQTKKDWHVVGAVDAAIQ